MIDRRPALIVRPTGAADVRDAVGFARQQRCRSAVRGGGHQVGGLSTVEGGVQIDLPASRASTSTPSAAPRSGQRRRRVGRVRPETEMSASPPRRPGDHHRRRRVHPRRRLRLALAEVRPHLRQPRRRADWSRPTASSSTSREDTNPELMWALRGAGANFGVVTSYGCKVHPIPPLMMAGMLVAAQRRHATAKSSGPTGTTSSSAPEDLVTALATRPGTAGGFRACRDGRHARPRRWSWPGSVIRPRRRRRSPRCAGSWRAGWTSSQPMPYTAFQAMLDGFAPGAGRTTTVGTTLTAAGRR